MIPVSAVDNQPSAKPAVFLTFDGDFAMSELSPPASSNPSVAAVPDLAVSSRGLTKIYGASGGPGAKAA